MGTFNTLSFHVALDARDGGLGNIGNSDRTTTSCGVAVIR